jgi:hypothetical protein
MNRLFTFILTIICCLGIQAQNQKFLDGLRANEPGKGTVTVTQSPVIDVLVNGNPQSANNGATQPQPSATTPAVARPIPTTPHDNNRPDATQHTGSDIAHNGSEDIPGEDVAVDTRKKVMRNSYKTTGFRIQVFSGGNSRVDKQKAEKAGTDMKRYFPNEPVYVHFYSPSWKCRMGNYRTQEEARAVLAQVKKYYPQACLVKGTISVQY